MLPLVVLLRDASRPTIGTIVLKMIDVGGRGEEDYGEVGDILVTLMKHRNIVKAVSTFFLLQ